MSVIETRGTLGSYWIKGLEPKVKEVQVQVNMDYSLAINSALGIENNKATKLFKDSRTDQARETITARTGFGNLGYTPEGEDYKKDSRIATYKTELNPVKYTDSVTITEEDVDDKIVEDRMTEVRDLMVAGMRTMDTHGFNIFNYGYTAQASLPNYLNPYGDGKPLFSVGHPRADGGTAQSNASATGLPLSEVNLETARQELRKQLTDRGDATQIGTGRLILLVPSALEKLAVEITKSTLRSNTANNDLNIYDGLFTVMSTKRLDSATSSVGSDTAWFVIDPAHSKLMFLTRRPLTVDTYVTNSNKNYTVDISARYVVGWTDWRGTWGSKGNGLTYSS